MYSNNKKVFDAATSLYITILKAVEEVIGYYTQHMCKYSFRQAIPHKYTNKTASLTLTIHSHKGTESYLGWQAL